MFNKCCVNDMEKVAKSYLGVSCYRICIGKMKKIVFWCNVGEFVHWGSQHLYFQHCSRDLLGTFLQLENTFFWLCCCFVVGSSESSCSSSPVWTCSFVSCLWHLSMAVASLIWFCEIDITTVSSQWLLQTNVTLLKNNKPIKMCHLEIFIFSSVWKCDCSFLDFVSVQNMCIGNAFFFPPKGYI